jgi:hypothetical protein
MGVTGLVSLPTPSLSDKSEWTPKQNTMPVPKSNSHNHEAWINE